MALAGIGLWLGLGQSVTVQTPQGTEQKKPFSQPPSGQPYE
jgi:hypothetical protein